MHIYLILLLLSLSLSVSLSRFSLRIPPYFTLILPLSLSLALSFLSSNSSLFHSITPLSLSFLSSNFSLFYSITPLSLSLSLSLSLVSLFEFLPILLYYSSPSLSRFSLRFHSHVILSLFSLSLSFSHFIL